MGGVSYFTKPCHFWRILQVLTPVFSVFFLSKDLGLLFFAQPLPPVDSSLKFTAWVETRFGFTADVFEEVEPTELLRCMRAAMRKTCRLNVMEEESTSESQGVMSWWMLMLAG